MEKEKLYLLLEDLKGIKLSFDNLIADKQFIMYIRFEKDFEPNLNSLLSIRTLFNADPTDFYLIPNREDDIFGYIVFNYETEESVLICPNCKGINTILKGVKHLRVSMLPEPYCKDCKNYFFVLKTRLLEDYPDPDFYPSQEEE